MGKKRGVMSGFLFRTVSSDPDQLDVPEPTPKPCICAVPATPQLTDVQSLKGVVGVNRYVLGVVSRGEDGKFRLEDSGGVVPLNLKLTETAGGFFTGASSEHVRAHVDSSANCVSHTVLIPLKVFDGDANDVCVGWCWFRACCCFPKASGPTCKGK